MPYFQGFRGYGGIHMSVEERLRQLELLLIEIKDAYDGGYRTCADESNIKSVEWAIRNIDKLLTD